jgi:NADP-dependent 3-hydroxy acid dehydrogenase YdfG
VSEAASAKAMVDRAVDTFGKIDIVVNNAGILRDVIFHKMTEQDWDSVIKVHLYGSFYVSRAAAEHFRRQESGAFVHMTSTSGLVGNPGQANYSAAKMGIVGLSKSLALDMSRFNVRSNCIAPFAWSRMVGSIPNTPDQEERLKGLRTLTPDKIAPVATFLASDDAKAVNGQIFAVRGNEVFLMSQPRPLRSPLGRLDPGIAARPHDAGAERLIRSARHVARRVLVDAGLTDVRVSPFRRGCGGRRLPVRALAVRHRAGSRRRVPRGDRR